MSKSSDDFKNYVSSINDVDDIEIVWLENIIKENNCSIFSKKWYSVLNPDKEYYEEKTGTDILMNLTIKGEMNNVHFVQFLYNDRVKKVDKFNSCLHNGDYEIRRGPTC